MLWRYKIVTFVCLVWFKSREEGDMYRVGSCWLKCCLVALQLVILGEHWRHFLVVRVPVVELAIVDFLTSARVVVLAVHWVELKINSCWTHVQIKIERLTFPFLTLRVYKKHDISTISLRCRSSSLSAWSAAFCQCFWHCQHWLITYYKAVDIIFQSHLFGAWVGTPFARVFLVFPVLQLAMSVEVVLDVIMLHWCSAAAHFGDEFF